MTVARRTAAQTGNIWKASFESMHLDQVDYGTELFCSSRISIIFETDSKWSFADYRLAQNHV